MKKILSLLITTSVLGIYGIKSAFSPADGDDSFGRNITTTFNDEIIWDDAFDDFLVGTPEKDEAYIDVTRTSDNKYIAVGGRAKTGGAVWGSAFDDLGIVTFFNTDGSVIFNKTYQYNGNSGNQFNAVIEAENGDFIIVGKTLRPNTAWDVWDAYWLRITRTGDIVWESKYGTNDWEILFDIKRKDDGGYVVIGMGYDGSNKGLIMQLDETGQNRISTEIVGNNASEELRGLTKLEDGSFVAVGISRSTIGGDILTENKGGKDGWVVHIDASGNFVSSKLYGGSGHEEFHQVIQADNGDIVIVGDTSTFNDGDITSETQANDRAVKDALLFVLPADGSEPFGQSFGGMAEESLRDIAKVDGGFHVVGFTKSEKVCEEQLCANTMPADGSGIFTYDGLTRNYDGDYSVTETKVFGGYGNDLFSATTIWKSTDLAVPRVKDIAVGASDSSASGNMGSSTSGGFDALIVIDQYAPEITVPTEEMIVRVSQSANIDFMAGVVAKDIEDGDITDRITLTGVPEKIDGANYTVGDIGTYTLTYEVIDNQGNIHRKTRLLTITQANAPTFTYDQWTFLNPGDPFNPLENVSASDVEDGILTDLIEIDSDNVNASTPGNYSVTYSVTDSDFNTTTVTRVVIVTEAPKIISNGNNRINPDGTFDPMAGISATDNEDDDTTLVVSITGGTGVNTDWKTPGTYTLIYSVTDSDNNTTTVTRTITVTNMPTIGGIEDQDVNPGSSFDPLEGVHATDVEDGDFAVEQIRVTGSVDTSTPGTYELTYSVTDVDGNTTTVTRTITVTEAPVIIGASNKSVNPDGTFDPMAGISATDKEDDNSTLEVVIVGGTGVSSNWKEPGIYTLVYEVVDSDGNETHLVRKITVTHPPQIIGASDKSINPGSIFEPLDGVSGIDNEDGDNLTVAVLADNVITSTPGQYEVVYSVTDSDGNVTTLSRIITVTHRPEIKIPGDVTVNLNDEFNPLEGVSASDVEDGVINDIVVSGIVDTSKSGDYTITYSVTDSDGNETSISRIITVMNRPIISLPDENTVNKGGAFDPLKGVNASDVEDGNITHLIEVIDNNLDISKVGTYTIKYRVTDSHGNTHEAERLVEVILPEFDFNPSVVLLIMVFGIIGAVPVTMAAFKPK